MPDAHRAPRRAHRWLARPTGFALAAVALADGLFFNTHAIGLALPLFLGACGVLVVAANPIRASARLRLFCALAFFLALAALVEDVSWLSVLVAGVTALYLVRLLANGAGEGWPAGLARAMGLPFVGPFRLANDLTRVRRLSARGPKGFKGAASLAAWIAPVLLTLVFLGLFDTANPLIHAWLSTLDLQRLPNLISLPRLGFWLAALCLVWPLVRLRRGRRRAAPLPPQRQEDLPEMQALLGPAAVLRSLVLFNALFAVQTGLDAAYLWGGRALPDGMSHAAYAHRGAYPLIVTALLAAAFVLAAMRPGGPAAASRWIRPLVLVFVAQNVALVTSSILRTALYVETYGLTQLRLAAFIWMGLVGLGLMLIVVQILHGRSNAWLLTANAIAVAATLYLCCFANFPYIVARYNLTHWQTRIGMGSDFDVAYLVSLGPDALPAYVGIKMDGKPYVLTQRQVALLQCEQRSAARMIEQADWRSWTFRNWRLKQVLAAHPLDVAPAGIAPAAAN
ncbi:DUF4173 domain-containing protein [Xanthobacter autotrophicus DSM 431]|uniref:DUF4153 domain-containing protein n=1 Tax=Xanthobacter nonsaccharivorans TaxID=3119912 RepID=UPI00372C83E0